MKRFAAPDPYVLLTALGLSALAIIGLGGTLAQVGAFAGWFQPYCEEAPNLSATYDTCEPCRLHFTVFAALELNACPNRLLATALMLGIQLPHAAIIVLTFMIYPITAFVREWAGDHVYVVMGLPLALLIRTTLFNFFEQPNIARGIHRVLICWIITLAFSLSLVM